MKIFLSIFGFSAGIMVGSGVVAILILIGTIPRMAQVSNTKKYIGIYEKLLVIGTFLGSVISVHNIKISTGVVITVVCGLSYGVFVGFLSSGLTEIIDYIPVVSRRLKIPVTCLRYIIISLLIGKVIGSFLGWMII